MQHCRMVQCVCIGSSMEIKLYSASAADQTQQEQYNKYEEDDLRNCGRSCCNSCKSK